jgi:hypothetical protein
MRQLLRRKGFLWLSAFLHIAANRLPDGRIRPIRARLYSGIGIAELVDPGRTAEEDHGFDRRHVWSWGEKIIVTFAAGNSLVVRSEYSLPTQCIDWGKNRSHVRKFLDTLREQG